MKIMSWNVRGISSDGNQDRVRRLINRVNPDVVLVQETKLKKCDNLLISKLWPFGKVDWLFSPAVGASGGLISLWDRKVFDKWEHRIEKQVIGIRGRWVANEFHSCEMFLKGEAMSIRGREFRTLTTLSMKRSWWICPYWIASSLGLTKNTLKFNTGPLAGESQVIKAELCAIKTALNLFSSSCWVDRTFLIVESDSKNAISRICHKESRPWKEWHLFAEIDQLIDRIKQVDFVHIFREANAFADSLAKLGSSSSRLFYAWL
ncbi:hypothetical protein REPUB_Repub03eG0066800 [Reevesia pubescens]